MASSNQEIAQRVRAHLERRPQLLFFYSLTCQLCRALEPQVSQVSTAQGIPISQICADADHWWAPELLAYKVERVPCLVLLDAHGEQEQLQA